MTLLVVTAATLSMAIAPLLANAVRLQSRLARLGAVVFSVALSAGVVWAASWYRPDALLETSVADRPIRDAREGFATSDACRACHPQEHATWRRSYHRTMTQVAGPETVRAPFDGGQVVIKGKTYSMRRAGDDFIVTMPGPGDATIEGRIVLITGSHHQQAFWMPSGDGRKLAQFPLVYRFLEQRWIPLDSVFLAPPGMSQLAGRAGEWNVTCSKCHATQSQPRLEAAAGVDTRVLEFGIACEACHGPGEEHVRLNGDPRHRYGLHMKGREDTSIVNPSRLSEKLASQVCGQCHGVFSLRDQAEFDAWADSGFPYRPGQDLAASRAIVRYSVDRDDPLIDGLLEDDPLFMRNRFWNDGMVRIAGREYNGLIESPCYMRGNAQRGTMTCMSCHTLHQSPDDARPMADWADDQLKPALDGDAACLQCHKEHAGDAAIQSHTHHKPGSPGSLCQNCHMPHTSYGLLKAMRSHTIESPDVAVSVRTGRPNACNLCHLDASLGWTAERLSAWYGMPAPDLSDDERTIAASVLWLTRGDAGQRVLVAWHMGWKPAMEISGIDWMPPLLAQLMLDDYDAVRLVAYRSLRAANAYADFQYDFLTGRPEQTASVRRVFQTWSGQPVSMSRPQRGRLLVGPGHAVGHDDLRRLMAQRDHAPIYLNE